MDRWFSGASNFTALLKLHISAPPGALTGLLLQDYMQGAGEEGVLLVALGTVTELGEARPLLLHMLI